MIHSVGKGRRGQEVEAVVAAGAAVITTPIRSAREFILDINQEAEVEAEQEVGAAVEEGISAGIGIRIKGECGVEAEREAEVVAVRKVCVGIGADLIGEIGAGVRAGVEAAIGEENDSRSLMIEKWENLES